MKGNAEVIKVLNVVLRNELTGINQYFIHLKAFRISPPTTKSTSDRRLNSSSRIILGWKRAHS